MASGIGNSPRLENASRHFDKDLREDYYTAVKHNYSNIEEIKTNFTAVACLMMKWQLEKEIVDGVKKYKFSSNVTTLSDRVKNIKNPKSTTEPKQIYGAPLKKTELFADQLAPGFGSAFRTGYDEIITAGHCIGQDDEKLANVRESDQTIKDIRVVFGFYHTDKDNHKKTFEADEVYKIKEIRTFGYSKNDANHPDIARIQLNKIIAKRFKCLEVDLDYKEGDSVYSFGCSTGIAVKVASVGIARIKKIENEYFLTNDDILGGCSGGPVIKSNGKVIGITVRGQPSYQIDEEHLAQTGERTVISYITPEDHQKKEHFNHVQKLRFSYFNPYCFISTNGHANRPYLSKIAEQEYIEKLDDELGVEKTFRTIGIVCMVSIIALPGGIYSTIKGDLDVKKLQRRRRNLEQVKSKYGISLLEAKHLNELKNQNIDHHKKIEIVKNMAAYNLNEDEATALEIIVKH